MSQLLGFTTDRKTARGNLLAGWLAGGTIQIYTMDRPASADTAINTQTLLVTFNLQNPAGIVSDGVFTSDSIGTALIAANGIANWARIYDSNGVTICDGDVGLTSESLVQLDSLILAEGGYCSVVSFSIAEG